MIDCAESFVKSVQNAAKQPDKRKHFVGGMLVSFLIGLYNPFLGFLSGVVAAALKEWWDSKDMARLSSLTSSFLQWGFVCVAHYMVH